MHPGPAPAPTLLVPRPARAAKLATLTLYLCVLLPRVALFFFNQNLHGDAAARTDLAMRWARAPHWITSFQDGACQFGPLHLYAMGLVLKLWPDVEHAGRLLSLVVGVLSAWPLLSLTRRLFGERAARWACLGFAVWGIHIQLSTTAASEALALFFVLGALALFAQGLSENRFGPLALSALVLNLACAVRYDAWLLAPLLVLLLWLGDRDRVAATTRAVLYGLCCLPFPLLWLHGNELATGDPLYPIHFINTFHVRWFQEEARAAGELSYRLYNGAFWPGIALLSLSPLLAAWGALGMAWSWRQRKDTRWLICAAIVPTVYFAVKGAVLASFVPLGRFTVNQVVLLLPFAGPGFDRLTRALPPWSRRALIWCTAGLALIAPVAMGAFVVRSDSELARSMAPISPVSRNPPALMEVARFLREQTPADRTVVIDRDPHYRDMQIGFFSHLPRRRVVRALEQGLGSWPDVADPAYLVWIDGGALERDPALSVAPDGALRLFQYEFRKLPGFAPPYRVYRRASGL